MPCYLTPFVPAPSAAGTTLFQNAGIHPCCNVATIKHNLPHTMTVTQLLMTAVAPICEVDVKRG